MKSPRLSRPPAVLVISAKTGTILAAGALALGSSWALAATSGGALHACAQKSTGTLRLAGRCSKHERPVTWNIEGPRGLQGPQGVQGTPGTQGVQGIQGDSGSPGATNVTVHTSVDPPLAPGGFTSMRVMCNIAAGERAVGGGGGFQGNAGNEVLQQSYPANANGQPAAEGDVPEGWWALVKNANTCGGCALAPEVWVICAGP